MLAESKRVKMFHHQAKALQQSVHDARRSAAGGA